MSESNIDLKILKDLSKDEEAYNKLCELFNSYATASIIDPQLKPLTGDFNYFFWSITISNDKDMTYYLTQ